MRVCLINPPRIQPKLWGKPSVFQPLDIAYVAAVLEEQHKVCIIDAPTEGWRNLKEIDGKRYRLGLTNEEIAAKLKVWSPDFVVITVPFSGWLKTALEVASTVKSIDKNITNVLIGMHPSTRPADCLVHSCIDFVVIGEPEQTVSELASVLERGENERLREVRGISFINNGERVITPRRPFIQDLDSLPFPARHLLPMDALFVAVKENPTRGEIRKPCARILTSRGCPHNCIFCSNHIMMGKKWRGRSPQNVVDEIEQLVNNFHIKQIDFEDDNLTADKKRMETICDLIIKRRLDIKWYTPNGVRADNLDENLLTKMKSAGCERILIAPESGVQHVVNQIIKKDLDLEKVEQVVTLSRKVGIKVGCFFIMGFIGETKNDIKATINYAYKLKRLGADHFYFNYAMPLFGTELYEQAKSNGFLKATYSDETLSGAIPLIETPEFSADDLRKFATEANLVNPAVTRDRLLEAARNPKKAMKFLFGRITIIRNKENSEKD